MGVNDYDDYNDTAMVVACPACMAPVGKMCTGSSRGGTTHWYLEECHAERYAVAKQTVRAAVAKALDDTA